MPVRRQKESDGFPPRAICNRRPPMSIREDPASPEAIEPGRMRRVFDLQRSACDADPYPDLAARKSRLRRLVSALRGHQNAIIAAVNTDFGVRSAAETRLIEVLGPVLEARHALSHLRRWMRPRQRSTELLFLGNGAWVAYQPKGVVGIIGTWNFPVYMTLGPLIAALAPRGKSAAFAAAVNVAFAGLYPAVGGNVEYTSLISERHVTRIRALLEDAKTHGATVLRCGDDAGAGRQIPLHVVTNLNERMQLMHEEIFGPILPVLEYDRLDDAMAFVRARERPLSMYAFGLSGGERRRVLQRTHAGGVALDDWGWHVFQHDLPFGGTGNSGMGSYHGEEGFRELSHGKAVFKRRRWFPISLYYPPYGNLVQRLALWLYLGKRQ